VLDAVHAGVQGRFDALEAVTVGRDGKTGAVRLVGENPQLVHTELGRPHRVRGRVEPAGHHHFHEVAVPFRSLGHCVA